MELFYILALFIDTVNMRHLPDFRSREVTLIILYSIDKKFEIHFYLRYKLS